MSLKMKISFHYTVLFTSLIVFAILSLSLFDYERITGDATLYISIAQKYVNGDFTNAINGYWGPLLSWLMVPFLFFGFSHLFTVSALNVLFGLFAMIGVWKLSYRFQVTDGIRSLIFLILIPVNLYFSIVQPMDYLLLCVLIYYLSIIFRDDYHERISHGIACGVLGACAYFSKPFGFPFFISHYLLMNLMHCFGSNSPLIRKKVVKNALVGFSLFALLSGAWIALISMKYDRLTFSNQGKGVFSVLGPGSDHHTLEKGDPIFFEGFMSPPNETAFVIYEDPSHARKKTWNPLGSWDMMKRYVRNLSGNIITSIRIYESYSRLSFTIIIAYLLFMFREGENKLLSRRNVLYPLLTVMLYTAGYMPFHFEARYLWIINILILLMGSYVLTVLFQYTLFKKRIIRVSLAVIFVLSFTLTPLKSMVEASKKNVNRDMHRLSRALQKYDIRGNFASNSERIHVRSHNSWHKTFRLSYWLNSRYYGQARENMDDEELHNELKKFNIDYFFYWGNYGDIPEFLTRHKEVTGGEIPGLMIYSLKEIM